MSGALKPDMSTIKTFADAAAVTEAAVRQFIELAQAAIAARQQFSIALSGGSTPKMLFERLAQEDLRDQVDWSRIHVFWGDERAVPPDHEDSNYRVASELLLHRVPILAANVHRIHGEKEPLIAARDYEDDLRAYFSAQPSQRDTLVARFDLVLLGMGDDGHTASLFPGAAAIHETQHWVCAYQVEKLDAWRISLTPLAINGARQVTFVVTGENKAKRLRQVLYGPYQPNALPSQSIRPTQGRLLWMLDEAAAGSS
jgi:6-phosphogluconolactonase